MPTLAHHDATTTHFVDGDAVLLAHLVKFVDAHDAAICHHHGAAGQVELAAGLADDRGRQTSGRGALAAGVHACRHAANSKSERRVGGRPAICKCSSAWA